MSLNYKFDKLGKNNPEKQEEKPTSEQSDSIELYETAANVRNVYFSLVNGEREFFNYSYLISCKFSANKNTITLKFTSVEVEITGLNLESLFMNLLNYQVRQINEVEKRYISVKEEQETIVTEINIKKN